MSIVLALRAILGFVSNIGDPLNIIFAGTSAFAVPSLDALIHTKHQVIAVYTPPDRPAGRGLKLTPSPIKQVALAHQIPIFQPASLKDPDAQQTLKNLQADVMIVAAYGLLLPQKVLDMPRYGCINIHPSLLPRWRGAAPIPRPIEAGDLETGVTIMQLDAGLDTGPIWTQTAYLMQPDETTQSLHDVLASMSVIALLNTLDQLEAGQHHAVPQNDAQATYAAKIEKSEAQIDWHQSAIILERKIRAFNPWPVAWTTWHQQSLRIWQARALSEAGSANIKPGTVIAVHRDAVDVCTGDGILRLLTVQLPGGKPLSVTQFIHGHGQSIIPMQTQFIPILP